MNSEWLCEFWSQKPTNQPVTAFRFLTRFSRTTSLGPLEE